MENLNWNNSNEKIKEYVENFNDNIDLRILLQPTDEKYNKNVWEGCAMLLAKQENSKLEPYIFELLEWLQDANWPGFSIILERLKKCDAKIVAEKIMQASKVAQENNDETWPYWLNLLLENPEIYESLNPETIKWLKSYKE